MIKTHWQTTLEAVGTPVSLAEKAAVILEKQAENPFYQRTKEEQEVIDSSWKWWVAQGMQTIKGEKENGHS